MNIVLIDDDEDDTLLFCEAMKEVSTIAHCITFRSAANAIAYLTDITNDSPSHIFIDAHMHPMNGEDTLKALLHIKALAASQMIIHSGRLSPGQHEIFLQQGAHLVIHKAENYDQLCDHLRSLLTTGGTAANA